MARKSSVDDFVIDFSKEEGGQGGGIHVKPARYRVKIVTAKPVVSANKGTKGLELMLQIVEGKYKGKKLRETLWATTKAYSRFRFLLAAVGKKAPTKVELGRIANAVKGAVILVDVDDEEREGYKTRSRVDFEGFYPEDYEDDDTDDDDDDTDDDLDEVVDEEEDEPPKKRKKKKPEPEDDDDDDDLDLDDL